MLSRVPFSKVSIDDGFWTPRIETNTRVTAWACIKQCENTGRVANFTNAGLLLAGRQHEAFQGLMYNDSDVYKVLEGVAYVLRNQHDAALENKADEIIAEIASAQYPDGYINTYFTLVMPQARWTDMMYHEMYCMGHLIEAGIAYYEATGKKTLFETSVRAADHLYQTFYKGGVHWIPGHQEIELALVKLYNATADSRYLDLARYLVEQRGQGYPFLDVIKPCRDQMGGAKYNQDDKPVAQLSEISGHAVRAMYYYAAIADLAAIDGNADYAAVMDRIYASMMRNMYITGGIGQSRSNEGFTADYDLPNDSYCETCAAVGVVYWASRMNRLKGVAGYMDEAERAIYNGSISGISLAGDRFFYVNPLVSDGSHHRMPWHNTSCCPTQITRFLPSVGDYIYASDDQGIYVNLYIQSSADIEWQGGCVMLRQTTNYPWEGAVALCLEQDAPAPFTMKLRIPHWCMAFKAFVDGVQLERPTMKNGYLLVPNCSKAGQTIRLELEMPVRLVTADERVEANRGRVAVARGPLVYCMEAADNPGISDYAVTDSSHFVTEALADLGNAVAIRDIVGGGVFIPYYAWDNREAGAMQVWVPCRGETAHGLYSR